MAVQFFQQFESSRKQKQKPLEAEEFQRID